MRRTRNTYQDGWIEIRPSKKGPVFVYRWRERKPSGGYTKRTELIGPVSVLKTETNAWRAVEHRKLEINSEDSKREAVTINSVIGRYVEEELPELRHSTADAYRSYLTNHIKLRWGSHPIGKIKRAMAQTTRPCSENQRASAEPFARALQLRHALGTRRHRCESHEARARARRKQAHEGTESSHDPAIPKTSSRTRRSLPYDGDP